MSTQVQTQFHKERPALLRQKAAERTWQGYILWIIAGEILGFGVTAIFSGYLEMGRDWFLVAYLALTAPFLVAYVQWTGVRIGEQVRRHLFRGLVGAVLVGGVMVLSVQRMDASPRAAGIALLWDILWLGVVYGVIDALLLNVLPVMSVWRASALLGRTASLLGKLVTGGLALVASLVVTAAYHLGYTEFRGSEVTDPLLGNTIMSLGYLIFANPITAVVAHVALHIASVMHGVDTTVTLPPHY